MALRKRYGSEVVVNHDPQKRNRYQFEVAIVEPGGKRRNIHSKLNNPDMGMCESDTEKKALFLAVDEHLEHLKGLENK